MKLFKQPVFLVGFRPFFILACIAGVLFPVVWALSIWGNFNFAFSRMSPMQWHAHEMFYGFGWAILGGFLLTATKNWVGVRGYHGSALALLAFAWLIERLGIHFQGQIPTFIFVLSQSLFLSLIIPMLVITMAFQGEEDSYSDNFFFVGALPAFFLAKFFILRGEHFQLGVSMTLALFRICFLVMLERTLTQFVKAIFNAEIYRNTALDYSIKICASILVFEALLPTWVSLAIAVLLGLLLLVRFFLWRPGLAIRRIDIFVMYLGYLGIVLQLAIQAQKYLSSLFGISFGWTGSVQVHSFTFGTMGLIIPAMIVRIAKGHTGRKAIFNTMDKFCLWIMLSGFIVRIILPQFLPGQYRYWVMLSAIAWLCCFSLLLLRYAGYLVRPRIDGKEH